MSQKNLQKLPLSSSTASVGSKVSIVIVSQTGKLFFSTWNTAPARHPAAKCKKQREDEQVVVFASVPRNKLDVKQLVIQQLKVSTRSYLHHVIENWLEMGIIKAR